MVDERFQCHVIDAGRAAFAGQIEAGTLWFARAACGRLQHAQAKLDPIVCGQSLRHERWQQQVDLPELLNDFGFHVSPPCARLWPAKQVKMTPLLS